VPVIEIVEHTGELEMRVRAETREGLYGEALRGLALEVSDVAGAGERRAVELTSSGPDTLLADLLNEAIYLMDVEGFVATGLEVERLGPASLRGALVGARDPDLRPLAKAATYHGLVVREGPEGWEGRVVLDV
jgi:SHS2 domain-containing protein